MDYFLSETQQSIKEMMRKVAIEKVLPIRAELDEKEEFPRGILELLGSLDLMGLYIPEAYGGLGGGALELCLATEELARVCAGVAVSFAANALGATPILIAGSERQKKEYLPKIASGEYLAAFGLTEPEAGSDVSNIRTTAVRVKDKYILNGTKQWITNGGEADVYTIFASTNRERGARGLSAFIVEKDTPGFSCGKKEKKMGIRCSATGELIFEDAEVPDENLLGKEGRGFLIAMRDFAWSRTGIGAQAVGIAQGALDEALQYARGRIQFGHPIISFQAIQFMLADMATQIEAARALVLQTARNVDANLSYAKESAMAKLFASDMAQKVTSDALQIFGGYGYMRDYPVEKMMRDAKITQIYEGTNQIQRGIIALKLIKERASHI